MSFGRCMRGQSDSFHGETAILESKSGAVENGGLEKVPGIYGYGIELPLTRGMPTRDRRKSIDCCTAGSFEVIN
jgi:hypothetical protein